MAYWSRKSNSRVYIYSSHLGKERQVPRHLYSFLDAYSDAQVEQWVNGWEEQNEGKRVNSDNILYQAAELSNVLSAYCIYREKQQIDIKTIRYHKSLLTKWVIPYYFQQNPPLKEPRDWAPLAPKLLAYFEEKGVPPGAIEHANNAFRKFWDWLQDEGLVLPGTVLKLRNQKKRNKETPLPRIVSPDEVLAFAAACPDTQIKLMALVGYFFSLRPFELFALRPKDFRAGLTASQLECCRQLQKQGAFDRLAAFISRNRIANGNFGPPKTKGAKAWVGCFNEVAAREIVALINVLPIDVPIIALHNPDWNMELWRRNGIVGITLKDLRRASLYWLGHHLLTEPIALKNHARHSKLETTMLYCRRPTEVLEENTGPLSLD